MAINGLDDLFAEGLRRLYAAHHQGAKQTGRNHGYATSPALRKMLKQGVKENVEQARRLERVFRMVGLSARGVTDPAMDGIRDSDDEVKKQARDTLARDLAIIASGQIAAHYYIATYGTLREYARAELPATDELARTNLALPMGPLLSATAIAAVVEACGAKAVA